MSEDMYARVQELHWMEAENLASILDHCGYSYRQFTSPENRWEQRSLHIHGTVT